MNFMIKTTPPIKGLNRIDEFHGSSLLEPK